MISVIFASFKDGTNAMQAHEQNGYAMPPAKSFQARLKFRIDCQEVGVDSTETLTLPPASTYPVQQRL